MVDGSSKPAIPAWQKAQKAQVQEPAKADDAQPVTTSRLEADASEDRDEKSDDSNDETAALPDLTPEAQLENMKSFLADPSVKDASPEKKRAFFESKGISKDLIEQVLREESVLQFADFESFRKTRSSAPTPNAAIQKPSSPPIITYPEFLVDAHKPPPLITIGRIWNATQIVGGLATLFYGASKYLVAPMTANLTEARHDLALHSQGKIDEMNERIGKLLSKLPEQKPSHVATDSDESESETSDPTELFHRDMGTQTTPPGSRSVSLAGGLGDADGKNQTDYQCTGLAQITSHLNDMLSRSEKLETPNKERQEKVDALRHYVDTLMYASPNVSMWASTEDLAKTTGAENKDKEDAIEDLKKEIRGVKGVMLSAKRFPGVGSGARVAT